MQDVLYGYRVLHPEMTPVSRYPGSEGQPTSHHYEIYSVLPTDPTNLSLEESWGPIGLNLSTHFPLLFLEPVGDNISNHPYQIDPDILIGNDLFAHGECCCIGRHIRSSLILLASSPTQCG